MDTDPYYRHFRNGFDAGEKVPNASQHLKCCVNSIFVLYGGGSNTHLVRVIVKALLFWD